MATLNIPSYIDDPNYRYKMPKLMSKVEGRGNGVRTNIMNMSDIAKALKRPPEYTTKFCGHELGAPSKFESNEGKAIVNGAFETKDLQQLIDKFIEKYVLCSNCNLPEIDIGIHKGKVAGKCNACGGSGDLDNAHKLATFIVKNPPSLSTMGTKKGRSKKTKEERQAEKAKRPDGAEGEEGEKKKKKSRKSKKGDKEDGEKEKKTKKKSKKSKKSKTDEPTGSDVDDSKATSAAGGSDVGNGDNAEGSGEDKSPLSATPAKIAPPVKRQLSYDSPEIDDVRENLQEFMKENPNAAPRDFFDQIRILQVSLDFSNSVRFFVALDNLTAEGATFMPTNLEKQIRFLRPVTSGMDGDDICTVLEDYVAKRAATVLKQFPFVLQKFYNADLLEEDAILAHYETVPVREDIKAWEDCKKAAAPFLQWLKEEETEEDSEDEDEEATPPAVPCSTSGASVAAPDAANEDEGDFDIDAI